MKALLTIEEERFGPLMMEVGPVDGEEASIQPTLAEPASLPSQWGPPEHDGVAISCQCVFLIQAESFSLEERMERYRLFFHFCISIFQI